MLKPIHLLPKKPDLKFTEKRSLFFIFSVLLVAFSIGLFMTRSLNYGIDFQGGIMIEIRTPTPGNIGQMRSDLSGLGLGEINIQEFGEVTDFLIRVQKLMHSFSNISPCICLSLYFILKNPKHLG